jgi:hypothetical protein
MIDEQSLPNTATPSSARKIALWSFTAPFSGLQGWYWENTTDSPYCHQSSLGRFHKGAEEFGESN